MPPLKNKAKSPNEKVMAVLQKSLKPLTAYEILARLNKTGVNAPPTVYRALTKLIKDGVVHRIESLNAFIMCRSHGKHGHADNFAVCNSCGSVAEIHDHRVEKILNEWSSRAGFKVQRETIEILGTCADCNKEHHA